MNDSKLYNILVIAAYLLERIEEHLFLNTRQHVANFIAKNYGDEFVVDGIEVMETLISQNSMLTENGREDSVYLKLREAGTPLVEGSYESKMNLLAFFIGLSIEAGCVELEKLHNVTMLLGLEESEVDTLLDMLFPHNEEPPVEKALRVLGLPPNATESEIKAAYRRLSLQYHPDRNLGKSIAEQKEAERRFKEIVAAKETLEHIQSN